MLEVMEFAGEAGRDESSIRQGNKTGERSKEWSEESQGGFFVSIWSEESRVLLTGV